MTLISEPLACDAYADPFGERWHGRLSVHKSLLGGSFRFTSDSEALLALVESAYGGLPAHRWSNTTPEFHVALRRVPGDALPDACEPPRMRMQSGAGLLCGVIDASNYVVISPSQRRALVVASGPMLGFPYHLRYELIEFAVFVLATRGLGLVPLHGACVGREGRGILLLGASGAGKSTLALHALLHGLDFLAEDTVLVQPDTLLATGVANYVHVKADALRFIDDEGARRWIASAPVIRRRSGVEKFEADVRRHAGRLAPQPLKLVGAAFVCAERADDPDRMLAPVRTDEIAARLQADQPYAAGQPGWLSFQRQWMRRGMHELRRGAHPESSVHVLRQWLQRACR